MQETLFCNLCFKKTREVCGIDSARLVYFAYFHSIMSYGVLFWGRGADWSRVFILQKRAIRTIKGMQPRESCRDTFRELGILTLPCVYILECLLYSYRNLPNTPLNSDQHNHDTRSKGNIRAIGHR